MTRHLLIVDDVTDAELDSLLVCADEHRRATRAAGPPRHIALLFLETSLRTRTGFAAAAHRLGWPTPVEVIERRASAESMPERLTDTVAVLAGYFDTLVARLDGPIEEITGAVGATTVVLNAGDRGLRAEHPTQAIIDTFAMEQLVGPVRDLRVVLAGDLRMRAARSQLELLARRPPRELSLVTDPALTEGLELPAALNGVEVIDSYEGLEGIDALHAIGIPDGSVDEATRDRLRVDPAALDRLSPRGRVFSPMPVIDEVDRAVRGDGRLAFLDQSALALFVRMALLDTWR